MRPGLKSSIDSAWIGKDYNISKIDANAFYNALEFIQKIDHGAYIYVVNEHLERLLFTASYIAYNFPTSIRILDVGSGVPFLSGYLSLTGFKNINTVDIGDISYDPYWRIQTCKLNIEEETLPFENSSFDLILLLEVFEHLYKRPNHVFREIRRVLRPGGTLIISTPNGGIIKKLVRRLVKGRFDLPIYDFSLVYENVGHFGHIREYSVSEIKKYLKYFSLSVDDLILNTFCFTEIADNGHIFRTGSLLKRIYCKICNVFSFFPMIQSNIFIIAKKQN
jgi:SAM-dependent methyltransferase